MKKMNKKGFTLIEMLVVIAIIAVLVSIVIPTVSSATEKAKEAADAANIRAAIAEVTTNALANGTADDVVVKMKQATADFVSEDLDTIGGLTTEQFGAIEDVVNGDEITISWDAATDSVKVTIGEVTYTHPTEAPAEDD